MPRHSANRSLERGMMLIWIALFVAVLAALASLAISYSYAVMVRSELQVLADAGSHAGTSVLCARRACWDEAKRAVVHAVNSQRVHLSAGTTGYLAFDPEATGSTWNSGGFTVRVARGRWTPAREFESFENWETETPGRPGYVAANAVRVIVERNGILPLFGTITQGTFSPSARAVALSGEVSDVPGAPFALPVCSMLDPAGEPFGNGSYCSNVSRGGAEIYFTRVNGFCPGGNADCGIRPSFMYNLGSSANWLIQPTCGWRPQGAPTTADSFGVMGVPESVGGSADEPTVRSFISSYDPQSPASGPATLGTRYYVLENGLTTPASEDAVWGKISGFSLGEDTPGYDFHPYWSSVFGNFNPVGNLWMSYFSMDDINAYLATDPPHDWAIWGLRSNTGWCGTCFPLEARAGFPEFSSPYQDFGLCRSRRVTHRNGGTAWCIRPEVAPADAGSNSLRRVQTAVGTPPNDLPRVWKITIPVIADVSAEAATCEGASTAGGAVTEQAGLDPDHPFEIVGFTSVILFDVDIGGGLPITPPWIDCGFPPSIPPEINAEARRYGFTAQTDGAGNSRCNLVRASLACDRKFVAQTGSGPSASRFVK